MLKAIFFDLDHTLYDRFATMRRILPIVYRKLSDNIPEDVSYERFRDVMIEADREYNYAGWSKRVDFLYESGLFKKKPDYNETRIATYKCFTLDAVHFPYTFTLLGSLREKGYKLGIITNGEPEIQHGKVERLHFSEFFDIIYFCGDYGVQKPNVKPFLESADMAGVLPEEFVYVGDNPKNDIAGAKNAGMKTVWVATCGPWRYDEYPRGDYDIENIGQLESILPEIEKSMV